MGKSTPKVPDPLKQLPFPGLKTGAFSLQRAQPSRTVTRQPTASLPSGVPGLQQGQIRAGENVAFQTGQIGLGGGGGATQTTSGAGPFELTRTDQTVPEGELGLLGRSQALQPRISALGPQFSGLFGQSRERLEGLLGETRPGFGNLTQARVQAIDRNRARTIGNLREAFGKRNVLGASFAQGEIRAADQEFAQLESEARAQSAVEEIELSSNIIQNITALDATTFATLSEGLRLELSQIAQEQSVIAQRAQRELEEFRVAGGLITGHTQIASNLATVQAQLAAQAQADQGSFFGTLVGLGARIGLGIGGVL